MTQAPSSTIPAICLAALLSSPDVFSGDWPQWRGPRRDGGAEFAAPAQWPKSLKEEWKVVVGEGHSSPVVVGGKVYLLARQGDEEVIRSLDCSTGKELWRSSYAAPYKMHPAAESHGKGPKSTPVVGGGRLYTFGISGILSCIDPASGEVKWRKEFTKEYERTSPLYGTAMSPLLLDNLCIAHVGGHDGGALTAFDAQTGEVKWSCGNDGPGYASPIAVELLGDRQVVTQTQDHLMGVSLKTGELRWQIPFKTPYDQNAVTVAAYQDTLIYSGLEQGIAAIRVAKEGAQLKAEEVWRTKQVSMYLSSPVLQGNRLFGLSHQQKGQLFCLDADSGKTLWVGKGGQGDCAAILSAGKLLILLTSNADLLFIEPGEKDYRTLAQYKVASTPTWAHPVVLGDRILIKDRTTLALLGFGS